MQKVYWGPWPVPGHSRAEAGMEYLVCIGSEYGPPRQLVSVFSQHWMLYLALYQPGVYTSPQLSPPRAELAAPVSASADESRLSGDYLDYLDWDYPYPVDDSLRVFSIRDDAEADCEVDKWYTDKALKKKIGR